MLHPSQPGLGNKEEIDSKLEPPYLALESKVDNNYFHESDELHYDKIQRRIHYRRLEEKNQTDFTFFFFFWLKLHDNTISIHLWVSLDDIVAATTMFQE